MPEQVKLEIKKDESIWPIYFRLQAEERQVGRWTTYAWTIEDLCLNGEEDSNVALSEIGAGHYMLPLELFRDERMEYRFNLNAQDPHLFFVCAEEDEQLKPVLMTAAQGVAARYMDGDYVVLHIQIPLPIQVWMEAYLGRHGELEECKRRGGGKGKKQKGRSSGY
ncbi:DUF3305 domain-containing protein [Photobacterium angustum]|uniref:DUF3305 domain-containing protein n=1 Tax=Photobacterium angustum TaxID=661 RepID=A0A2S7VXX7_PHOAN|nr:DUF3305 domain-containing protein [Photobacterium angustum]PQJ66960.1 hypothetical protein BTO08_05720 [Photobacterium angustum]